MPPDLSIRGDFQGYGGVGPLKKRNYRWFCLFLGCFLLSGCSQINDSQIKNLQVKHSEVRIKKGVTLEGENIGELTASQVRQLVMAKAASMDKAPKEAQIDADTWKVIPSVLGRKVDIDSTVNAAVTAEEGQQIKLTVKEVQPSTDTEKMQSNIVEIASYTTPLLDRGQPRVNNIEIAGEEISGEVVLPGAEFSYNEALGRRTKQKGYKKAPIFVKDGSKTKKKMGIGGGICQLSSTLYNAVREAGLKVTERHEHSKDVGYVPKGKDATVVYGSEDFKFVNTRNHPIMIKVYRSKTDLTVKLIENRNL